MRSAFILVAALVAFASLVMACEKNNDVVTQEQFQASQAGCPKGCELPAPGCDIKGNISTKGERFYHMPGTKNYNAIKIQVDKGERWFCTEPEAQANGFVRKDY
jgi:hypothetical protein